MRLKKILLLINGFLTKNKIIKKLRKCKLNKKNKIKMKMIKKILNFKMN